jgi:cyclopropane-fatty-acyl-phospholipid synthase
MLPAPTVLRAEIDRAGLDFRQSFEFGQSYAQTLKRWHETFQERWGEVARLGFDARFKRMWEFYLCSCAAAFSSEICDVTQVTVAKPA